MSYLINPYVGFQDELNGLFFPFGIDKSEFHALIKKEPNSYMSTLEYYDDYRVDYDRNNKAIAFEFFSNSDLFIITDANEFNDIKEKNLFKIPFVEINKILCVNDPSSKVTDAGVISLKYGIGTYLEDSEEDVCESIIIFKKGYYATLGW
mgnify:FL=1